MRYLILTSLLLAACGTEETTTTTTTTVEADPPSKANTVDTPQDTGTDDSKTPTDDGQTTSTPRIPKTFFLQFKFKIGSEGVGIVSCEVSSDKLFDKMDFGSTTDEAKFNQQAQQPGCEKSGEDLICTITDNYTIAVAECGTPDPVTGGRSGRKNYKVYTAPDLSAWKTKP